MKYEFSTEEILAALQNGTDPDAIAKAFTDALNGAVKQKQEAEAASKKDSERVAALKEIFDKGAEFVKNFYPDMYREEIFAEIDIKDIDRAIAEAYEEVKQMNPLFEALKDLEKATKVTVSKKTTTVDPIAKFLAQNGL